MAVDPRELPPSLEYAGGHTSGGHRVTREAPGITLQLHPDLRVVLNLVEIFLFDHHASGYPLWGL